MPRQGWIKLHRSLLDNPMWLQKPFSEGQAWVDLLMLAAHEDHETNGKEWKAGTVQLSKKWLMERWGWSRRRIDATLRRWVDDGRIEHTNERTNERTAYTVLTIVKWDFFQNGNGKSERTNEHTNEHQHKKTKKFSVVGGASETPSSDTGRNPDDYEMVRDENGGWIARRKR